MYFLDSHLDIFPENWGQSAMRTECNFTRKFLPWKSGTKASGIPVCWLIITGHLEEMFHMQNIAESHPLLFLGYIYTGCPRRKGPNFGRVFLRSNYTDITQNTYIQSSMVTEILARENWGYLLCLLTVARP